MKYGKFFASALVCAGMVSACMVGAQAKIALHGTDKLYADLNKDGRVERVSLVQYNVPRDPDINAKTPGWDKYDYTLARIVVFNDKGKVIWRSPEIKAGDPEPWGDGTVVRLCDSHFGPLKDVNVILQDLDGDGFVELCIDQDFGCGGYYKVLRWKNNQFYDTGLSTFGIRGDGSFRLGAQSPGTTRRDVGLLQNLHKSNGKLIAEFYLEGQAKRKAEFYVDNDGFLRVDKYLY